MTRLTKTIVTIITLPLWALKTTHKMKNKTRLTIAFAPLILFAACHDKMPSMVVNKVQHIDTCGYWVKEGDTSWLINCTSVLLKPESREDSLLIAERKLLKR